MSHKNSGSSPTKGGATSFPSNLVTSLGSMQPNLPSLAPAPQQQQQQHGTLMHSQQQQLTSMAQQMGHQPQQHQPPMQAGQFQVIQQQPYATAAAGGSSPQFATIQNFATYNQQGQLVLQQGSFALPAGMQLAQQPGQQQYILTAAPNQKPGQPAQMIASPAPASQGGKPLVPMSQGQGYAISGNGQLIQTAGPPGMQQTYMFAGPIGGMSAPQNSAMPTSLGGQLKQIDQKPPQGITSQSMPQAAMGNHSLQTTAGAAQAPQQYMLHPGMTYMSPQGSQAFLQNGQLIFRSAAAQDPTHSLMFSSTGQHLAQQSQMQGIQQQLATSMASTMQPMTLQTTSGMRPPTSGLPMQPPPGKTPISRNLPQILPTTRPSYQPMPIMPGLGMQQPSPKLSKQKVSPRGGGPVGRPPGPGKSQLNTLKGPDSMSPGSLGQCASPQLLGPPVLQTSHINLIPHLPQSIIYSQPPKLQPQVTTVPSSEISTISTSSAPINKQNADKKDSSEKAYVNGSGQKPFSENRLVVPKAVVKPNVLTHVIDGHLIEESSEPFPVDKGDKANSLRKRRKSEKQLSSNSPGKGTSQGTPERKRGPGRPPGSTRQNIEQQRLVTNGDKGKSEVGLPSKKSKLDGDEPLLKPSLSSTSGESSILKNNPLRWTVPQVCDFVRSLSGCSDYVEDFLLQEIDGQALMLLKADHLMSAMQIKLGPALKICSAVEALREELKQN